MIGAQKEKASCECYKPLKQLEKIKPKSYLKDPKNVGTLLATYNGLTFGSFNLVAKLIKVCLGGRGL